MAGMESPHLRSRPVRLLMAAALLLCVALASVFIVLHRVKDLRGEAVEPPDAPLTDAQSMEQVVGPAREFVTVGRLAAPSGSYLLTSCEPEDGPPYQGTAYVEFDVPTITETPAFFRRIARAVTVRGWTEGLPPNSHPGGKLFTRQGVSAFLYRNPDLPGRGVLQIYGECRNTGDHRADSTGFVDISDRLSR